MPALDLFLDAGGLAGESAQVVELGATHVAPALDLDLGDRRAVGLEDALHALAVGDLAHREGRVQAAVALGDDDALEGLETLAVALLDLDLHDHGIAGGEIRDLAGHLLLFELLNDLLMVSSAPVLTRRHPFVCAEDKFIEQRLLRWTQAPPLQQIRARAARSARAPARAANVRSPHGRRRAAPAGPTAVDPLRAGVVRAIQQPVHMRILPRGVRHAQGPRQQPDHRIHDHHGRQFAAAQDIVTDGPLLVHLASIRRSSIPS